MESELIQKTNEEINSAFEIIANTMSELEKETAKAKCEEEDVLCNLTVALTPGRKSVIANNNVGSTAGIAAPQPGHALNPKEEARQLKEQLKKKKTELMTLGDKVQTLIKMILDEKDQHLLTLDANKRLIEGTCILENEEKQMRPRFYANNKKIADLKNKFEVQERQLDPKMIHKCWSTFKKSSKVIQQKQQEVTELQEANTVLVGEIDKRNTQVQSLKDEAHEEQMILEYGKLMSDSTLDFSGKRVGDIGAERICQVLKRNVVPTGLSLGFNKITDKGLYSLVDSLEQSEVSALALVDLSENELTSFGMKRLSEYLSLPYCPIKNLNVGWNQITDEGAQELAKALEVNTSLNCLNLWGNQISSVGVIALLTSLQNNSTLGTLDLSDNPFDKKLQEFDTCKKFVKCQIIM